MSRVLGKELLCSTDKYRTYFKSIQGFGSHTLFERYDAIENVVNKKIDEQYRHFLAQPVVEGDSIIWFSKPYSETPQQYFEIYRVKIDQDTSKQKMIHLHITTA